MNFDTDPDQTVLDTLRHKSFIHEQDRGAMNWHPRDMHLTERASDSRSRGKGRKKGSRASEREQRQREDEDSSEAENLVIGEALKAEKRAHGFGQADVLDPALLELAQQQLHELAVKDSGKVVDFELQQGLPVFIELLISKYNELHGIDDASFYSRLLARHSLISAYKCMLAMLISYILFILSHVSNGLSTRHPVFLRITELKKQLDEMQPEVHNILQRAQVRSRIRPTRITDTPEPSKDDTETDEAKTIDTHGRVSTTNEDSASASMEDLVVFGSDESDDSSTYELEDLVAGGRPVNKHNNSGLNVLNNLDLDLSIQSHPISGDRSVSAYEQRVQRSSERREAQRLQAIQAAENRKLKKPKEQVDIDIRSQQLADAILQKEEATKEIRKAIAQNQKGYEPTYYDPTQDKIDPTDRVGYRPVSINMKKGQGNLKRHKSKHASTSRTLLRYKYEKAVEVNKRTAVPTREQNGAYTGEIKGICTSVTHSRKLS
ncbi:Hypothetical protein GLP15_4076 [Giardia lamblia P15]|uniref:Sas10 C-terminal domain-containing protein n=1 Tax=Giardia intestinalis (strain P15) TaxID=658858 RepID=E1F3A8_GIAIA|nr:Hypothetical protein GLP15_4076 [Giardia lamblia P15]